MINPRPVFILRAISSGAFALSHHSSSIEERRNKRSMYSLSITGEEGGRREKEEEGKKTVREKKIKKTQGRIYN